MSYGGFSPKKMYSCPCLLYVLNQVLNQDFRRLDDIKREVEDLHQGSGSGSLYCICVNENKENVIFLCKAHLNIIVRPEMSTTILHKCKKTFTLIQSRNFFVLAALDIFVRNLLFYFLMFIIV